MCPCLRESTRAARNALRIRAGTVVSSTMNVLFKVVIACQIVAVLVRQLIFLRLPLPLAKAVRSAGHDMAEDVHGMRVPVRAQRHLIKALLDGSAGLAARHKPLMYCWSPDRRGTLNRPWSVILIWQTILMTERLVLPVIDNP